MEPCGILKLFESVLKGFHLTSQIAVSRKEKIIEK